MRDPFDINKRLLLALCDLPMQCAATMLGLHKSCLVRIREKFDMPEWPYQAIMRGTWSVMSKEQVVQHRDDLIAELEVQADIAIFNQFRMLQSAKVSARMFWQTSSGVRGAAAVAVLKAKVLKAKPVNQKKRRPKFSKRPKQHKSKESDSSKEETAEEVLATKAVQQEVKEKLTMDFNPTRVVQALPVPPAPFWPLAEQCTHYCDPCDPSFEDVLNLGPIPKRD